MPELSIENIWGLSDKEFIHLLDSGIFSSKDRKIQFYTPSFAYQKINPNCSSQKFPTISVTGKNCMLNCKHCAGRVLQTMLAARTPAKLFALAQKLKHDNAVGCLISGGCLSDGSVPLEQFIPVMTRMKNELGLTIMVHTGIVNYNTARALKEANVDAALIDIIGSVNTMKEICNLNITTDYYEASLNAFHSVGLRFVPHVIVGLQNGVLSSELEALRMIRKYEPTGLVIIAFMPIRGTKMEHVKPPSSVSIGRVVVAARLMFPEIPLALGCMRPKAKHRAETDVMALKAGVDAVAFPSEAVVKYAKEQGLEIVFSPYCCAKIYTDLDVRSVSN